MKQYCASDLHLGYEHTNYDKVCKFLDITESKSDELILPGDTFDLWRHPISKIHESILPKFKEALNSLKEVANEIPVIIIPGNHDHDLSKIWNEKLRKDYNVIITNSFYQGNVYYTHGWQFDVEQRFGSFAYGWLVTSFPYIYQRFFKKPSRMGLPKNDTPYKLSIQIHKEAENFVIKNNLDYIVMGHTHIPKITEKVIDCGDFIDSCSYVIIENKKPTLHYI